MQKFRLGLFIASAIAFPTAAEASITISSNFTRAFATDTSGVYNTADFYGTSIPTSTSLNATDGPSSSQNTIDWTTNGSQTILSWDLDHRRAGTLYSIAETVDELHFTSDSNTTYDLSGHYDVTDAATGSSGLVYQFVQLYDLTANISLFRNLQDSRSTPDESFTLGGVGGDYYNSLAGSLTGNVLAGHTYHLILDIFTQAYPDGDAGASALGNLTLRIGEAPAAVPEPLSAIVWGSLIAGVVFRSALASRQYRTS